MLSGQSEDVCRKVLEPHHDALWDVLHTAWGQFRAIPNRRPLEHKTVRANVVWGYAQDEAAAVLLQRSGITLIDEYGTKTFLIDGEVVVRLKKLGEDGLSRNYPTDRALDYNGQLELTGISASALRVDVGYRLNELETEIRAVEVVCRVGDKIVWSYEINAPVPAVVIPIPSQTPATPAERTAQRRKSRVRARGEKEKEAIKNAGARRRGTDDKKAT